MNTIAKRVSASVSTALLTLWSTLALAQDPTGTGGDVATTTTHTTTMWYSNVWVWAAGVAVFLIIIIALTQRGGSSRA